MKPPRYFFVFVFFVLAMSSKFVQPSALFRFNFIYCEADPTVVIFEECGVKVIGRNRRAGVIVARFAREVADCKVHFKLMKKYNGWRPYLYDIKFDACDFLDNQKKYSLLSMAYRHGKHQSKGQHRCPYKVGEVLNVNMEEPEDNYLNEMLKKFPIEMGQYGFFIEAYVGNKLVVTINSSTTYNDYRKIH